MQKMDNEQLAYHGKHESGEVVEPREGYLPKHLSKNFGKKTLETTDNREREIEPKSSKKEIIELINREFSSDEECAEAFLRADKSNRFPETGDDDVDDENWFDFLDFLDKESAIRKAANKYYGHDNAIMRIANVYAKMHNDQDKLDDAESYRELALRYGNFGSLDDCKSKLDLSLEEIATQYATEDEILRNARYLVREIGYETTRSLIKISDDDTEKLDRIRLAFGN